MYYVYILQSKKDKKIYTGFTKDLEARIKKHKSKSVYTTKRMGEIELIYYEAFKAKLDAVRREKYLKTTKGKRTLKINVKSKSKLKSSCHVQYMFGLWIAVNCDCYGS